MKRFWNTFKTLSLLPLLFLMSAKRWILGSILLSSSTLLVQRIYAKVFMSQEQALRLVFPEASRIERKTLFLTPEQKSLAQEQAQVKIESNIVTYYEGWQGNQFLGRSFFDQRLIRTFEATLMITTTPQNEIRSVEVLAFHEPMDYMPHMKWLKLFIHRTLSKTLRIRQDIPNVSGSTLTCYAVVDSVRKCLAINQLLKGDSRL
jgi:hypothetical protein